jgi:flavin reductase (DIM6/NTAB) family NADH-FMN oxidoreductase RutF
MEIDPAALSRRDAYWLTVASVIPRPIGWTSTLSSEGRPNLAPFSFFGGVSSDPPTVMLSVGRRRGGAHKDTARNLLATKEAVVHIAHVPLAEKMVATSADVEPDVDEFELAGLTKVAASVVEPYRIAEAAIALEARMSHHQEVGNGPVDLFLLEIVRFHLADELVVNGLPDAEKVRAVARCGGIEYCATERIFRLERP